MSAEREAPQDAMPDRFPNHIPKATIDFIDKIRSSIPVKHAVLLSKSGQFIGGDFPGEYVDAFSSMTAIMFGAAEAANYGYGEGDCIHYLMVNMKQYKVFAFPTPDDTLLAIVADGSADVNDIRGFLLQIVQERPHF